MNKDIYILGGARTPMADYTGKLKDFSALDLGAHRGARGDGSGRASRRRWSITSSSATCCRRAPTRSMARGTSG